MDHPEISKKDQIILQQLDVIRTMTDHNLSRVGTDFWGNPIQPLKVDAAKPAAPQDPSRQTAAPPPPLGTTTPTRPKQRRRLRKRWRICRRSWTAISA